MTFRAETMVLGLVLAGVAALAHGEPTKADSPPPTPAPKAAAAASPEASDDDVSDLPVHEVPAEKAATDMLGLFISGDGGWWTLDNALSQFFSSHGMPIAGISSYKYFATPRTPDTTADDMVRVLRHYLRVWKKERIVLMGYSLGGEIIPFVAARLPEDLRKRTVMAVMIGPSANTYFEFHTKDWVLLPSKRPTYPVQPEIERIAGIKLLCVTGDQDNTCICDKLDPKRVTVITRSGNHHFKSDYKGLAQAIWDVIEKAANEPPENPDAPTSPRALPLPPGDANGTSPVAAKTNPAVFRSFLECGGSDTAFDYAPQLTCTAPSSKAVSLPPHSKKLPLAMYARSCRPNPHAYP